MGVTVAAPRSRAAMERRAVLGELLGVLKPIRREPDGAWLAFYQQQARRHGPASYHLGTCPECQHECSRPDEPFRPDCRRCRMV